jgi:hypothetical protein
MAPSKKKPSFCEKLLQNTKDRAKLVPFMNSAWDQLSGRTQSFAMTQPVAGDISTPSTGQATQVSHSLSRSFSIVEALTL